jgi:hypothetical protein
MAVGCHCQVFLPLGSASEDDAVSSTLTFARYLPTAG